MQVSYFYDPDIGTFYYGPNHPMKPHRITLTNNLILHYGLYNMLESYKPRKATGEDMVDFHSEEYINFLQSVTPQNKDQYAKQMQMFNVGEDCPVFSGQFRFCQLYAGGSIGGAVKLNYGLSDVVINWAGGLHHAKKSEASGFCYVNDIVLAILELLKYNARVLYIDIDIHHGDGVEEAFMMTDKVMTVSFHKYGGGFFPGTGDLGSVGRGQGKHHSINVPLKDGMTDTAYEMLFKPVMRRVVDVYQPEVIVFQSGADSLAGDKLGAFNLLLTLLLRHALQGHAECQQYMMSFGLPMLVLGGGGYNIASVARCWAYETGRILGVELEDELPENDHQSLFQPGAKLHLPLPENLENLNTRQYLENLQRKIFVNIARIGSATGQEFRERPPDAMAPEDMETEGPSDEADDSSPPEGDSAWPGGDSGQRAQLWDGRGRFEDAPLETGPGSSGRARIDLDYSRGELI
ncbi:histone deacetylase 3 [Coccomyxa subellipsoidea C-169]|uniref:Histone deacetylase n=1 Tax=Coccomyxa subellipsoidea (strain C-169) TaxID=574566 RepID=I0YX30_COCSC|nr:histone deacetylase 3 [Coccomyxa subellipsoidea C-169]EIE22949.1 histone deacetylase 3 [Coccomyxa subellipsoidea C-169]|eukprot:XP_005647493.1 histone deacetylase 3 [Coccomyxa subellipsoidea C-169]